MVVLMSWLNRPRKRSKSSVIVQVIFLFLLTLALNFTFFLYVHRSAMDTSPPVVDDDETPPTITDWCAICREDGCLELYSVPQFNMVFCVRNFSTAPNTLMDSGPILLPR